jgi:hypothetical protein
MASKELELLNKIISEGQAPQEKKKEDVEFALDNIIKSNKTGDSGIGYQSDAPDDGDVLGESFLKIESGGSLGPKGTPVQGLFLKAPTPKEYAIFLKEQGEEARRKAEEGGLSNAFQFGFAETGPGGFLAAGSSEFRKQGFEPRTTGEFLAKLGGSIFGESLAFIGGPTTGFVTGRVTRELNRQMDDPNFQATRIDEDKIIEEAGKGVLEKNIFGAAGRTFNFLGKRLFPTFESKLIQDTVGRTLRETGKALGRGTTEIVGEVGTTVAAMSLLDGAEFHPETALSTALSAAFFRGKGAFEHGAKRGVLKEGMAKVLARHENIPLVEARKQVLVERGFSGLARDRTKKLKEAKELNKVTQEERIAQQEQRQIELQQRQEAERQGLDKKQLTAVEAQNQEYFNIINEAVNIDHFVNNTGLPEMKAHQKTNNKVFDEVGMFNIGDHVIDGTVAKAKKLGKEQAPQFDVQKGLGGRKPSANDGMIADAKGTAKYLFQSVTQSLANDTLAGAVMGKRYEKYANDVELRVGETDVNIVKTLSKFDVKGDKKNNIVKKYDSTDLIIDENAGRLLTKMMHNSPDKWDGFVADAVNQKLVTPEIGMKVKGIAPEWRQLYDKGSVDFEASGGKSIDKDGNLKPWQHEENYAERVIDWDMAVANPDRFVAELNRLNEGKNGFLLDTTAYNKLTGRQKKNQIKNIMAEFTMDTTMPAQGWQHRRKLKKFPDEFLVMDLDIQIEKMKDMVVRTEMNKAFGPEGEFLNQDIFAVKNEVDRKGFIGDEASAMKEKAENAARYILGKYDKGNNQINNLLEQAMNLNVVTMMATSFIVQPTQAVNNLVRTNGQTFLRAIGMRLNPSGEFTVGSGSKRGKKQLFKDKREMNYFLKNAGINLQITRQAKYDATLGKNGALRRMAEGTMKYTKFEKIDAGNRDIGGLAGMFFGDFNADQTSKKITKFMKKNNVWDIDQIVENPTLSKQLDKILLSETREFGKMNIDIAEVVAGGVVKGNEFTTQLNARQKKQAARSVEQDVNFRTRMMDLPEFRRSSWGRAVSQFGSFDFQNTKFLRDQIKAEALQGNFGPLRYAMSVGLGVGFSTLVMRHLSTKTAINLAIGEKWDKGTIFEDIKDGNYFDAILDVTQNGLLLPMWINKPVSFYKYGDIGLGPTAGRGLSAARAAGDVRKTGSIKPIVKEVIKQFSPAGYAVKNIVDPLFKKPKKQKPIIPDPTSRILRKIKRLQDPNRFIR